MNSLQFIIAYSYLFIVTSIEIMYRIITSQIRVFKNIGFLTDKLIVYYIILYIIHLFKNTTIKVNIILITLK